MKTIRITDASAASLIGVSLAGRLLSGLLIDSPALGGSVWICLIAGTIPVVPLALLLNRMRRAGKSESILRSLPAPAARAAALLLAPVFAFDASVAVIMAATSASFAAIDSVTTFYLLLPLCALCLWCLSFNGDSMGSSARLLGRMLVGIAAVIALVVLPDYVPAWLTPVLGPGAPELVTGSARTAGWLSLALPVLLICEKGSCAKPASFRSVRALLVPTSIVLILSLLQSMLAPVLLSPESAGRTARLSVLLANGRISLSLQLPLLILWFICLFYQMLSGAFLCAAMLQTLRPSWSKRTCSALAVLSIAALSLSSLPKRAGNLAAAPVFYALISLLIIVLFFIQRRQRGGAKHA